MTPKQLHHIAMSKREEAIALKFQAYRLDHEALNYEERAAMLLRNQHEVEPTRSILFRSAATMARKLGKIAKAKKLIKMAFEGNPLPEQIDELNDVLTNETYRA